MESVVVHSLYCKVQSVVHVCVKYSLILSPKIQDVSPHSCFFFSAMKQNVNVCVCVVYMIRKCECVTL